MQGAGAARLRLQQTAVATSQPERVPRTPRALLQQQPRPGVAAHRPRPVPAQAHRRVVQRVFPTGAPVVPRGGPRARRPRRRRKPTALVTKRPGRRPATEPTNDSVPR